MAEYEVRDVVCDYGVYEDGELKLILNSRRIALQIVELLKEDERIHRELNPNEKLIRKIKNYLKRPKCKNGYNCPDCIHSDSRFEGIKFRGYSCRINAR